MEVLTAWQGTGLTFPPCPRLLGPRGPPVVPGHHPPANRRQYMPPPREARAAVLEPHPCGHHSSDNTTAKAPDDLLGAEALNIRAQAGALHPAPDRGGAPQQSFDPPPEVTKHRTHDQQQPRTASAARDGQEPRRPGRVPQVWRQPGFEPRAPVGRKTHEEQDPTGGEHGAESCPEPGPLAADQAIRQKVGHRRTRASSGRRPMRTISR